MHGRFLSFRGLKRRQTSFCTLPPGSATATTPGPLSGLRKFPSRWKRSTELAVQDLLFDPQTSGGLLLAAAPEDASALEAELQAAGLPAKIVGTIGEKQTPEITVTYE